MKVSELIEILKTLPQEHDVILQKDPEGNGYDTASGASVVVYTSDRDVYNLDWSADDACFDSEEEWEEFKKTEQKVVVIYP